MTEDALIDWLKDRARGIGGERIGDDAAILPAGGPWATTVDSQIENVHFLSGLDPAVLARRLLAVNLSDLAAMGAEPAFAFLALSAPSGFDHRRFFEALLEACSRYGVELAGGDLSTQPTITAVLTLIGRQVAGGRFVERRHAQPGHRLWLGGAVGESALGLALIQMGASMVGDCVDLEAFPQLGTDARAVAQRCVQRHLMPEPQLALGRWLAECKSGAAIDISDGLAKDLHRMCRASEVSAEIDLNALEEPRGWEDLSQVVTRDWLSLALGGGEDYVLCFTLAPDLEPPKSFGARLIGEIRQGSGVIGRRGSDTQMIPPQGWDHLAG